MNDIESRLRATLSAHAAHAPSGAGLADRILTEVEAPARVLRPRHGWRTWTLPLLAAGAVAAVVAAVVGVGLVRHSASPDRPAVSHPVPSPSHPIVITTPAPTPSLTVAPTPTKPSSEAVTGFRVLDVTFATENEGWALGRANCVSGSGLCTALFHTTDGTTWQSLPGSGFNVPGVRGCAAPCVAHIRFATAQVGYAYGPDVLFVTTDGGLHWTERAGRGAEALETADGNVIRLVSSSSSGCPGPCNVRVETAALGSSTWTTVHLQSSDLSPVAVRLSRNGSDAYVLAMRNTAGGADNAKSTLYVSSDDGATWHSRGEPCPQAGAGASQVTAEVDSAAVAAAPGGTLSVLCASRGGASPVFVLVSHDRGAHFARGRGTLPRSAADLLAGDPGTVLLAAGDGAYRSGDGGAAWVRVASLAGRVSFVGFETEMLGRAVTDGGAKIWATADAGQTWTSFTFP